MDRGLSSGFFSHRKSSYLSRRSRQRLFTAAVEALEPRRLLSAGVLDSTYGHAGVTTLGANGALGGPAQSVVQETNGKFVAAATISGDFILSGYNRDGSPDTTFGDNGSVRTFFSPGGEDGGGALDAIALAPDGNIVALGQENGIVAVAQYTPNGTLDATFNGAGELNFDFTNGDGDTAALSQVTVDSDNRIVIAGYDISAADGSYSFAVARVNSNGTLDTSFNAAGSTPGEELISVGSGRAFVAGVAVNASNQIVLVGQSNNVGVAVAWLNADGTLNTAFNSTGVSTTLQFPGNPYYSAATAIAIDSDDRLVIVGQDFQQTSTSQYGAIGVIRVNSDGSLDATFNGDGAEDIDLGAYAEPTTVSVAIEPSGSIVVGGQVSNSSSGYDFSVAVINGGDGSLDTSFNSTGPIPGTQTVNLGGDLSATDSSVMVDSSGNILLGGTANSATFTPSFITSEFAFARLTAAGNLDPTFNPTGSQPGVEVTPLMGSQDVQAVTSTLQANGQTVVAYATDEGLDTFLVRLNSDGSVDATFGAGGQVNLATPAFIVTTVATASNGTIYIGGASVDDSSIPVAMEVYSVNSDGSVNTAFNGGNPLIINFPGSSRASLSSIAVDSGGNIVLAGGAQYFDTHPTTDKAAVIRLLPSGAFDTSFNSTGEVLSDFPGATSAYQDFVASGVVLNGGHIVLAGTTRNVADLAENVAVVILNSDGSTDTNFGSAGIAALDLGGATDAIGLALAVDATGRIDVTGYTDTAGESFADLTTRFTAAGAVDTTFNNTGYSAATFAPTAAAEAQAIAIDQTGHIIIDGFAQFDGPDEDAAITEFNSDGSLNTSFGSDGTVLATPGGYQTSDLTSVAVDSFDRLLVGGASYVNGSGVQAISARYTNGPLSTVVSPTSTAAVYGAGATLAATVASGQTVNTGTITFTVTNSAHAVVATTSTSVSAGAASVSVSLPAGAYTVTAAYADSSGTFLAATGASTLNVTPAPLGVSVNSVMVPYGSSVASFGVTYTPFVNGDGPASLAGALSFSTAATSASSVGGYPVSASGVSSSNYAITFTSGTLTIAPAALTVTVQNSASLYGSTLPAFSVSYAGFKNSDGPANLGGALAFSTAATSASPVGNYPVSAGGLTAANYAITYVSAMLGITPAALSVSINNANSVYGAAIPSFSAGYAGFVNGDAPANLTGTLAFFTAATSASPVGSYDVTAAGLSSANYTITVNDGTLSITPAALTIAANNANSVYGASVPTLAGLITGIQNGDSISAAYTTSATSASGVGGYAITPAAVASPGVLANYTLNLMPATLSITPAALTVSVNNALRNVGASNPAFSGTVTGLVNGDAVTVTYSTTAISTSPAGNYPINASVIGSALANYNLTILPGTLVITASTKNLVVTANSATRLYGAANPTLSGTVSGAQNGDTFTVVYSTTATATSPVGSYPITATVTGADLANYTLIVTAGSLSVTRAPLSVSVNSATRTYGAANPTFSSATSGLLNGDAITLTYSTTAAPASPVGNYPITPLAGGSALSNYNLTLTPALLSVTRAALSVSANPQTKVYGNTNPALTGSITGLQNGDNITATYATTAATSSGVGSYAITPTVVDPNHLLSNYTLTVANSTLTITKAALTITAVNQTKLYGTANTTLTASYSGFVNGDTAAVLTHAPSLTTTATTSSNVGSYPISVSSATAANYAITFVPGVLTVTPQTLYVIVNSTIKFIGQSDPSFSATDYGFVLGQNAAVLGGHLVFTTSAGTNSPIGIYLINASGLSSTNYTIVYIPGLLIEL